LIEVDQSSDDIELQIKVIDEGIGIPKEDLPNIFNPFFKSSDPAVLNKNSYGNGLALSICQSIMALMNGKITVKSKSGKGSTFKVAIKTKKAIDIVSLIFTDNLLRINLSRRKFYGVIWQTSRKTCPS